MVLTIIKMQLPLEKLVYFNAINPVIPHMIVVIPVRVKRAGPKINANTGASIW